MSIPPCVGRRDRRVAADIRDQLLRTGQPIGELDMMIAAHSLSAGAVLVTNNLRHYERIDAPLILENCT